MQVILSDGLPCEVRRLGLFELDSKGREILGPYVYTMLSATGQFIEDEYVLPTHPDDIPKPPGNPNTPEGQEQLRAYETYLAALAHEKKRIESYEGWVSDIAHYILDNCLSLEDRNRIQEDDWPLVRMAAVVPELTEEGIAQTLRDTFQGFIWQPPDFGRAIDVSEGQREGMGYPAMGIGND